MPENEFYVLITAAGHRFSYKLLSDNEEGAKLELEGFAHVSDNKTAKIVQNSDEAREWENSFPQHNKS